MQDIKISQYLEDLASKKPAPGGGAAAALTGAQAAALIEMVCNLSDGDKYKEHEEIIKINLTEATLLRKRCIELISEDEQAFLKVMAAYRSGDEQQEALKGATEPPSELFDVGQRLHEISESLIGKTNPNLLSDLVISGLLSDTTMTASVTNIEINLKYIIDDAFNKDKRKKYDQKR